MYLFLVAILTVGFDCNVFELIFFKSFDASSKLETFSFTFVTKETALFVCNTANKLKKGEPENKQPYYKNIKEENTISLNIDLNAYL